MDALGSNEKEKHRMTKLYDPPSGWQFGFPKEYRPLTGEDFESTLLRDGYPKELLDVTEYTRFWEEEKNG